MERSMARPARTSQSSSPGVLSQTISLQPGAPTGEDRSDPADQADKPSFWEAVDAVPEHQWMSGDEKGYKVYLYRDNPRSNTQNSGYKLRITQPFDIEWVKQRLGGWDYRAMLTDPAGKMTAYTKFSIDAPPKDAEGTAAPAAPAAPAIDTFQAQVLNLIEAQNRRIEALMDRMMDRPRSNGGTSLADSPDALPIMLKGVVEMFTGMIPKQSDPLELMVKLQALMPKQPDLFSMLAQAKELGLLPAGDGDLMSKLNGMLAIAEKLGYKAGGSRAPGLTEILAEKAPELIDGVGKIVDKVSDLQEKKLQTARTMRAIQANMPHAPGAPPAPGQHVVIGAAPGGAQSHPGAPAAPGSQVQGPQAPSLTALDTEPVGSPAPAGTPSNDDLLRQKIVSCIARGIHGGDIVGFMEVEAPQVVEMCEGAPRQAIEAFFANDPILCAATKSPNYQRCITEMMECLNGPEEDTDGKEGLN
jgi:hypothetical protein